MRQLRLLLLLPSFYLILLNVARGQATIALPQYQVFGAALNLMQFPKANPHIVIDETTLNSHCGDATGNTVLMNGCGIWFPPMTPDSVQTTLLQSWPGFDPTTWKDFVREVDKSSKIEDRFGAVWTHELVNLNTAKPRKPVDGVLLLSNVGFNKQKTEAVVYLLFLSYMDSVTTSGNLFLFRKDATNQWKAANRLTLIEMQK